ncbi:MAG: sugar phosphate nucleotidyltransferase [Mariprofundaceae bacterium]|nr:sugar phosphate nucleotidyltransferase [Mariprofundaceae bacterium]
MSKVTRAIILAAGLGTRLKSLTQNQPKALMLVAGEPAIVHVIRRLVAQGIHDIAINAHHHAAQLQTYLGNGQGLNARFYYSHEPTLLNSGGGVRTALDLLPDSGLVAVHNADIICDIDIQSLAALIPDYGCALALVENPKHHPEGDFTLESKLIKAKTQQNIEGNLTFSGVSLWHDEALLPYPSQQSFSLLEPIHQNIQQQHCHGLRHQGTWFDIGRHRDLVQVNRLLSSRTAQG